MYSIYVQYVRTVYMYGILSSCVTFYLHCSVHSYSKLCVMTSGFELRLLLSVPIHLLLLYVFVIVLFYVQWVLNLSWV